MKRKATAALAIPLLLCLLLCSCQATAPALLVVAKSSLSGFLENAANLFEDNTALIQGGSLLYELTAQSPSAAVSDRIDHLAGAIHDKTGLDIKSNSSLAEEPRGKLYITKKPINEQDTADFSAAEYFIGFVGNDLVIRAHNDPMLTAAIDRFTEEFVTSEQARAEQGALYLPRKLDQRGDLISVIKDGTASFTIVRPENASERTVEAAMTLQREIKYKSSVDLMIDTDFKKADDSKLEILLGVTNRPQTQAVLAELDFDNYFIGVVGQKLVITAPSDDLLEKAVQRFVSEFISTSKAAASRANACFSLPATLAYTHRVDLFLVARDFQTALTIVYPANAQNSTVNAVMLLAQRLEELTGATFPVKSDAEHPTPQGPEILIGSTNRSKAPLVSGRNDWRILVSGDTLRIDGSSAWSLQLAINLFTQSLEGFCADQNGFFEGRDETTPVTLYFADGFEMKRAQSR